MTDFYQDMAGVTRELLAPTSQGGLGQGLIELVRYTPAAAPPNAWDPPGDPTPVRTTLDGAATGVGKELIGAPNMDGTTTIVSTDLQVIVAPWGGAYEPGDVLELDGQAMTTILRIDNIPPVGIVAAIRFIVRR